MTRVLWFKFKRKHALNFYKSIDVANYKEYGVQVSLKTRITRLQIRNDRTAMGVNTKASLSTGQKHYRLSICSPRTRPSKGIVRQGSSICLTSKLEILFVHVTVVLWNREIKMLIWYHRLWTPVHASASVLSCLKMALKDGWLNSFKIIWLTESNTRESQCVGAVISPFLFLHV